VGLAMEGVGKMKLVSPRTKRDGARICLLESEVAAALADPTRWSSTPSWERQCLPTAVLL